ncbi:hypothetical protein AAMO2058_000084900 [Amorphochlora amoebiformis]
MARSWVQRMRLRLIITLTGISMVSAHVAGSQIGIASSRGASPCPISSRVRRHFFISQRRSQPRRSPHPALGVISRSFRLAASTAKNSPNPVVTKAKTIKAAVAEGLVAYDKGDIQTALGLFQASLNLLPEKNEKAEKQAAYYDMACCYSKLKNTDSSLDALEEAVSLGYDEASKILSDPDLAYLRKTERFQDIIRGISGGVSSSSTSLELEAEVRNPFRRFRQFVWGGAAIASGLGSAVSLTQTIGALTGKETIPLSQAGTNLAVNTAIAAGMLALLRFESSGNEKDKEQIQEFREVLSNATNRVSQMSKLKVNVVSESTVVQKGVGFGESGPESSANTKPTSISDLRAGDSSSGPRRIVVLAGNGKFVTEALKSARKADAKGVDLGSSKFDKERVFVVPVVMADPEAPVEQMPQIGGKNQLRFVAIPQDMSRWRSLLAQEFKYGFDQGNTNIFRDGIVLAIDELGRVVQRGVGLPSVDRWEEAFQKWWKQ